MASVVKDHSDDGRENVLPNYMGYPFQLAASEFLQ